MAARIRTFTLSGETVEKVPKQILWRDAEKNDFTGCATINYLTITKGRETPKNQALTILEGYSTVSEGSVGESDPDWVNHNDIPNSKAFLNVF